LYSPIPFAAEYTPESPTRNSLFAFSRPRLADRLPDLKAALPTPLFEIAGAIDELHQFTLQLSRLLRI
jgi:hypothetical protein